jgi:myo-inositol-1(or 4)-monophosphatase
VIETPDTQRLLAIAKQATTMASEVVRSRSPRTSTSKGDRDLTSDVDIVVEKFVRQFLRERTPALGFLGEEEGGSHQHDGLRWVLDPIDGTINFLHGLPLCAVSLSLMQDDLTLIAAIDMPFLGDRYNALAGHGSYVNNQRLQVSTTQTLNNALVSIDQYTFAHGVQHMNRIRYRLVEHLSSHVQRVRMHGSSAIDLAWTAHGRLDACIMLGNKPWDTSAGVLIAREAGARVLDLDGADHSTNSSATIAVTPSLEHELMATVHDALTNAPSVTE